MESEKKKLIISHFLPFSNNDTRLKTTKSTCFTPIFCFYCSSVSLAWYQINRQSTLDIWSEKKARPALARKNIRDISRKSWGHGKICKAISSLRRLQIVKWEMKCFYLFIRQQSSLTGAKEISFRKEAALCCLSDRAHVRCWCSMGIFRITYTRQRERSWYMMTWRSQKRSVLNLTFLRGFLFPLKTPNRLLLFSLLDLSSY